MFDRYRRILSLPGALRFSGSALVGRLPMAMVTIGIVLLATNAGRSYGLAGALSAVYLLAAALLGQLLKLAHLLADRRHGQVHHVGRPREAARLRDRQQGLELPRVHKSSFP